MQSTEPSWEQPRQDQWPWLLRAPREERSSSEGGAPGRKEHTVGSGGGQWQSWNSSLAWGTLLPLPTSGGRTRVSALSDQFLLLTLEIKIKCITIDQFSGIPSICFGIVKQNGAPSLYVLEHWGEGGAWAGPAALPPPRKLLRLCGKACWLGVVRTTLPRRHRDTDSLVPRYQIADMSSNTRMKG